jgi:hypothetical protein
MAQVIIYKNLLGGVSVTVPTGELLIEQVLTKDCPAEAIIVDSSILPQGADAQFFDAWELNGSTITVNLDKAKAFKLTQYNSFAIQKAQFRNLNDLAGIQNIPDDATWQAKLASDRAAISSATNTAQLVEILNP